ncbi:Signal recognition particle protein, partial [Haemophilus influenzae]
KILA